MEREEFVDGDYIEESADIKLFDEVFDEIMWKTSIDEEIHPDELSKLQSENLILTAMEDADISSFIDSLQRPQRVDYVIKDLILDPAPMSLSTGVKKTE